MNVIILNGPCGAGKSTSAALLHRELPGSVLVSIDDLRRLISGYNKSSKESWVFSMTIATHMIATALKDGRDVIVDKMIYDQDVLDQLHTIAAEHNARAHEFIIWADKETVMARAQARGYKPDGLFTPEKCERFWHEIDALKHVRKQAVIIDAMSNDANSVVKEIRKHISQ